MITEDYVSFETAKLLKEKGFDEATNRYYNAQYDQIRTVSDTFMWHWNDEEFMERVLMKGAIAIPTLQMAMKWLREEKKIGIDINTNFSLDDGDKWYYEYGFCIFQLSGTFKKFAECDYDGYKTYEQACEAAIKYCLENLI